MELLWVNCTTLLQYCNNTESIKSFLSRLNERNALYGFVRGSLIQPRMEESSRMPRDKRSPYGCIGRWNLLSVAVASTAWVHRENAPGAAIEPVTSSIAANGTVKTLLGGLTAQRFDEAQGRGAETVARQNHRRGRCRRSGSCVNRVKQEVGRPELVLKRRFHTHSTASHKI